MIRNRKGGKQQGEGRGGDGKKQEVKDKASGGTKAAG